MISQLQRWSKKLFFIPQIANPQILGLITLSQIRKFLRWASPQIANRQIVIINPQIPNLQTSTNAHRDFAELNCGPTTFAPNCELYIQLVHTFSIVILGQLEGATMY
jgi:hypothetical protein